jgi:tetratricopeptide (TPR) repeat protein
LKKVNAEVVKTRDLAWDALDGIVDRLRDELHDVPRATQIMMDTSRDSLELHRRMYKLQPDDPEMARTYVSSLYNHVLLEWLHGSREQSAATLQELQSAFGDLIPKYPNDIVLRITQLKVLLDRHTYSEQIDPALISEDFKTVEIGIEQLLKQYPDLPEVLKLATLAVKQKMTHASGEGDFSQYATLAQQRVELSQRFAKAMSDTGEVEGGMVWLAQAERDLATGLLFVDDAPKALDVLNRAIEQVSTIPDSDDSRATKSEKAQLFFTKARVHEALSNPRAAIDAYANALSLYVRLVQDHPDDVAYRSTMASALIRSAALSFSDGNVMVAMEQLTTAESQVLEVLKLAPDHAEAQSMKDALPRFRDQMRAALEQAADLSKEPNTDQPHANKLTTEEPGIK